MALRSELGQHRLVDPSVISRIIEAAEVRPGETLLDPGAGAGALTRPLADATGPGGRVHAVEVDPRMLAALRRDLPGHVDVEASDLLRVPLPPRIDAVVGNPPFKIAAPLLRRLVLHRPGRIVSVVPRELAERFVAAPGSPGYGGLTVWMRLHAEVEDLGAIPRRAFDPPPDVPCSLVRILPRGETWFDEALLDAVLEVAWDSKARHARRAFAPLAPRFSVSSGELSTWLEAQAWADDPVSALAPEVFAETARWLAPRVRS